MRAPTLGLIVPLLLLAAAFVSAIPTALAQDDAELHTISGRVLSDEGEPLAGVSVSGYTYHDDPYRSSVGSNAQDFTDEDGRYTLELREGKGWINVHYEKWRRGDGREITITGDQDDVDFTLVTPPPKTAIVVGTVVGPDGEPIEDAEVNLQYVCCQMYDVAVREEGGADNESTATSTNESVSSDEPMTRPAIYPYPYYDDYQYARTDEDGKFRFEAYGGPRQIVAWAKGYAQTTVEFEAEDDETTEVEVELVKVPARDAVIEGRVVNAETGAPLANAQINVRSLEWGRYAWAQTDKDGDFRIETVPGWTEISVSYYEYEEPVAIDSVDAKMIMPRPMGQQYYPFTTLVDLDNGDNELELDLEPKPKPTIALIGYVVDPDAKKGVEGARVNIWNHETGDWGEAVTDKTGSYKILVRPGHYTINAWKEGYLSGGQSFSVGSELTQRKDVLLPKGETRYAPCYDETDCGGGYYPMPMYAEADGKAYATPAAAPSPALASAGTSAPAAEPMAADAPQTRGAATEESAARDESGAGRSGTASFSGSGGGLPEYDPADTGTLPAAQTQQPGAKAPVPAAGLLVAALALVGAALVAARRK